MRIPSPSLALPSCILLFLLALGPAALAQVTVLLPDQPTREEDPRDKERQMDVLLALIEPFAHVALPLDMPQRLAVVRAVPPAPRAAATPREGERPAQAPPPPFVATSEELLGDCEEIRYLGEKSWATHVALNTPGLYTLLAETRPRFDAERQTFQQDFVKTILPVFGVQEGWYAPVGLHFEIVPQTRPFGLMAPAVFNGRVLVANAPLPNATVTLARLNTNARGVPTHWHERHVARTNAAGEFSLACPLDGWWCLYASTLMPTPLKGPDNTDKPLEIRAILWVYVDTPGNTTHKPTRPHKPKGAKNK